MTTNDVHPHSDDRRDEIDSLASDLVDGAIVPADIPEGQRADVLVRADHFRDLRSRLLRSATAMPMDAEIREKQISAAQRAAANRRLVLADRSPPRFAMGIAASFLILAGVSIAVLGRSGSGDDLLVSESVSQSIAESDAVPDTLLRSDPEIPAPEAQAMIADAGSPIVEYSSLEEISAAVESARNDMAAIEGLNSKTDLGDVSCSAGPEVVRVLRDGTFDERQVEIHVLETDGFIVYDMESCSVIARSSSSAESVESR